MRRGTRVGDLEAALDGVEHVGLVVGGVEVLAVPAGGEVVDCHYACRAGGCGEVVGFLAAGEDGLEAGVF